MSATSNWSYTNTATVWPLGAEGDGWDEEVTTHGEPFQIACTWVGGGDKVTNNDGEEFAPKYSFWHEDTRVKYGDLIARGVETDKQNADTIKNHVEYDMSPFAETTDYMSVV